VWGGGAAGDVLDKIFNNIMKSNSIFTNRDALRNDYIPDRILFRDDEIAQLGQMLAPILRGNKPSNIFLYGKTGTGKTVVAKYVMRKLSERISQLKLNTKFIYVNARLASTQYKVLVELGSQLDISIPFTGLSLSEASSRIFDKLRRDGVNVVLIFDEIDYIVKNYDDNILYELTRANNELLGGNFVSIVGISNDLKFKEYLDPRSSEQPVRGGDSVPAVHGGRAGGHIEGPREAGLQAGGGLRGRAEALRLLGRRRAWGRQEGRGPAQGGWGARRAGGQRGGLP
jgi:Cdc6-related protein, AAA superfamily ATPase